MLHVLIRLYEIRLERTDYNAYYSLSRPWIRQMKEASFGVRKLSTNTVPSVSDEEGRALGLPSERGIIY